MLNKYKNQKGSVMVVIIVVIAILIVLGIALLENSAVGFKAIKHEQTAELAYNAAQSGLERCFAFIDNYCSEQSNTNGMDGSDEPTFAQAVLDKITNALISNSPVDVPVKYSGKPIYKVELSSKSSVLTNTDIAYVEIKKIDYLGWEEFPGDSGKIKVKMGITANADYNRTGDKAFSKIIYSEKKVDMYIPRGFNLNAAIYSLGDLMVDNIDTQVTGDVVAYGTSPQLAKQIEQYYYGGIYAKNNGHLSVNGNAYSRSMIRVGEYNSDWDPSTIYIYKDAIANGIHIFGKGQKIVIGRNAYTFDDLELNGEDSVIAVNGNYIGLTNDTAAESHDQSSAIVNSAIVHYAGSNDSLKSRVVINGDVIVNGGTFRIDPTTGKTDTTIPQIEDASVIAINSGYYSPKYREYIDGKTSGSISETNYHNWLSDNRNTATGFSNLIQCWKPNQIDFTNETTTLDSIVDWMSKIDTARANGSSNDISAFDSEINTDSISGFCHYEIGANDNIYFMNRGESKIDNLQFINSGFFIDNIKGHPLGDSYWIDFWNGLPIGDAWKDVSDISGDPLSAKIKEIRDMLMPQTEIFANREYIYSGDTPPIVNTLRPANGGTSENLFLEIRDRLIAKYPGNSGSADIDKYIFNFSADPDNQININERLSLRVAADSTLGGKYFLFINTDPSKELIINGEVNGIVYSLGRVVIENGANITGSIIAAGNGFSPTAPYCLNNKSAASQDTDLITGTTYYLPQILEYGDNLACLDDGSYAGVFFRDDSTITGTPKEPAKVNFPGREVLLDRFKVDQDINLYSIFDF